MVRVAVEAEKTITPALPSESRRAVGILEKPQLQSNGAGNCGSLILLRERGDDEFVKCLPL